MDRKKRRDGAPSLFPPITGRELFRQLAALSEEEQLRFCEAMSEDDSTVLGKLWKYSGQSILDTDAKLRRVLKALLRRQNPQRYKIRDVEIGEKIQEGLTNVQIRNRLRDRWPELTISAVRSVRYRLRKRAFKSI